VWKVCSDLDKDKLVCGLFRVDLSLATVA
jgi:hypothetical protein